jgi:Arc/MetJ-type ribon-helix-helix transcriptional regulator
MSNQLAGSGKMKSASVRVHADLLDAFDDAVDESARWDSRSEAIRDFIETVVDDPDVEESDGRVPPTDSDLADGSEVLRNLSTGDRWVPEDRALGVLAQQTGVDKSAARQMLVVPLIERG